MTAGINRTTGQVLEGWPHVKQSLGVIITTRLGEMLLARGFGFGGLGLLGQNLTPRALMVWRMALVLSLASRQSVLLQLGEPRFRITSLTFPAADNSPARLEQGQIGLLVSGEYMPNALEGDFTVASPLSFMI